MASLSQLKQKETRVTCKEANEQKRETREKKKKSNVNSESCIYYLFYYWKTNIWTVIVPQMSARACLLRWIERGDASVQWNKEDIVLLLFSLLPPFLLSFSSFSYFFFSASFFYPAFLFSSYSFLLPSFFYVFNSVVRDRVHLVRCWRRNARTDAVCTVFYGRSSARMPLENLRFVFLEFYEIAQQEIKEWHGEENRNGQDGTS